LLKTEIVEPKNKIGCPTLATSGRMLGIDELRLAKRKPLTAMAPPLPIEKELRKTASAAPRTEFRQVRPGRIKKGSKGLI
jgi:hypothetical protein